MKLPIQIQKPSFVRRQTHHKQKGAYTFQAEHQVQLASTSFQVWKREEKIIGL